ncbi:hypothetical protein TNCT_636561 [Trichonephila clavata]|uniref:Uncharacterized protein n=1 Tax=Trichonephila clavata TaxID=2740835 RepID=A0A8X6KP88_TRICU|nr:hypothetical protein TNCT_636561 [Trichonephila clavata]
MPNPHSVEAAYLQYQARAFPVRGVRCFYCPTFEFRLVAQPTGLRFGETDYDVTACSRKEQYVNCKGEPPSCSGPCPKWIQE